MTDWKFENTMIRVLSVILQQEWGLFDLELEFHQRLISETALTIKAERKKLTVVVDEIIKSSSDEREEEYLIGEVEEEYNNFDHYQAVYLNSLYINTYTILENALLHLCENYVTQIEYIKFTKNNKKNNISHIMYYYKFLKDFAKQEESLLKTELDILDGNYRLLRNKLVHNRYLCSEVDKVSLQSLTDVDFHYSTYNEKYRIIIKNDAFLLDFLSKIRNLIKGIYVFYDNHIIIPYIESKKTT